MDRSVLILASGTGSLAEAIIHATHDGGLSAQVLADEELFLITESLNPSLVVSAGFMRILAPDYVSSFKVINSHPSLLPNFPGAHAVRDALRAKATVTGTTIHWVDAGIDTGEIIASKEVQVLQDDTEMLLHERIKIVERGLIVATISQVLDSLENSHE